MLNRGNGRATVFQSADEYRDFIGLLDEARQQHPVDLLAFCLMPNHFHLVTRVEAASHLSALMQWWLTSHVRRHHRRHSSSGHVWQGRFKSFPVQEDGHLLTVLRYVLLNPVRASLCRTPWAWRWSSLWFDSMVTAWPVSPPTDLRRWLTVGSDLEDVDAVRASVRRGTPFGDRHWRVEAATEWRLESTLRPRGRPRKAIASETALEVFGLDA